MCLLPLNETVAEAEVAEAHHVPNVSGQSTANASVRKPEALEVAEETNFRRQGAAHVGHAQVQLLEAGERQIGRAHV